MTYQFEIQTMNRSQLDFAVELAANEGWNPGPHDANCFYNIDPNGFFIGLLDGQPIGCIIAVSYGAIPAGSPLGFIGFYIVAPEYRGRGYGIKLWNRAMNYLSDHHVGLDGVMQQQSNYRKSGFKLVYRNIRYRGVVQSANSDATGVVPISVVPFEELCMYDRIFFPADRQAFLRCWTTMPKSKAVAFIEGGVLAGYGVIRQCREGYKIGPLFADNVDIAETLFISLSTYAEVGSFVYLDVPEVNPAAMALMVQYNMIELFKTARMYTGDEPNVATDRVYGVTTLEVG